LSFTPSTFWSAMAREHAQGELGPTAGIPCRRHLPIRLRARRDRPVTVPACLPDGTGGLVSKHRKSTYRGGRFRHCADGAVMLAVTVSIEAALLFRLRSVLDQLINELFRMADSVFTAKGSSYLFLVITLHGPSPDRWEKCLNNRIFHATMFHRNLPS